MKLIEVLFIKYAIFIFFLIIKVGKGLKQVGKAVAPAAIQAAAEAAIGAVQG